MVVRGAPDGFYVPLPFGERTHWYRNAVAAGGLEVTWKGRALALANPTIVTREGAAHAFNPVMRALMRLAGIDLVVRFDPVPDTTVGRP